MGEIVDQITGKPVLIQLRELVAVKFHGDHVESDSPAVFRERDFEDRRDRGGALYRQRAIADEVTKRVSDQLFFVALHPAQDMGTMTEHAIGAEVDGAAGERKHVPASFAQK